MEETVSMIFNKYLVFGIGGQDYALPAEVISQIITQVPITEIPQTPMFVKGIIELRGEVINIIDTAIKLNLPPIEIKDQTCFIICGNYGFIVENIKDMVEINKEDCHKLDLTDDKLVQYVFDLKDTVVQILNFDILISN